MRHETDYIIDPHDQQEVTLQDCIDNFYMKNICALCNDGQLQGFVKGEQYKWEKTRCTPDDELLQEEKKIARELADMVGSEVADHGLPLEILTFTAECLTADYKQIERKALELEEEVKETEKLFGGADEA